MARPHGAGGIRVSARACASACWALQEGAQRCVELQWQHVGLRVFGCYGAVMECGQHGPRAYGRWQCPVCPCTSTRAAHVSPRTRAHCRARCHARCRCTVVLAPSPSTHHGLQACWHHALLACLWMGFARADSVACGVPVLMAPRVSQGKELGTLRDHRDSVDQLCWHPSNSHALATASADKTVRVWDSRCAYARVAARACATHHLA